jgi:cytoskeletal protein CcmA (bactofilin family)
MFGKVKGNSADSDEVPAPVQQFQRLAVAHSAAPEPTEDTSSISSAMTIVGKITGKGTVKIFGRVEGELHATTVLISDGAHVEGDIVADELVIGGRVNGTVHASRVKLNSTAVVEGDIFHGSLAIEENARFEGSSRREDNNGGTPLRSKVDRPQAPTHAAAIDGTRRHNGLPDNEGHANPAAV